MVAFLPVRGPKAVIINMLYDFKITYCGLLTMFLMETGALGQGVVKHTVGKTFTWGINYAVEN